MTFEAVPLHVDGQERPAARVGDLTARTLERDASLVRLYFRLEMLIMRKLEVRRFHKRFPVRLLHANDVGGTRSAPQCRTELRVRLREVSDVLELRIL